MRAWYADGQGGLEFADVPDPVVHFNEALVEVHTSTIARGEIRYIPHFEKGRIPGLDLAGVVVRQAADGSGPPAGARVITMTGYSGGGWGRLAAVPAAKLGRIPDGLDWASAAALPNSGLTALYAVRHGGFLLGRKVLVTGATGAVGRIAAQLARLSGADVTGTVSRIERAGSLQALNLAAVAVADDTSGPFDLVVETLGGGSLSHAMRIAAPGGVVVTVGGGAGFDTPEDPAVVPLGWFHSNPGARLETENVGIRVIRSDGVARDLEMLAAFAAGGRLDLDIGQELPWHATVDVIDDFKSGKTTGRTILHLD